MLGALATISGTTIYPTPPGQDNPSPTSQDAPEIHPPALVTMNSETYTIQHSIVQIAGVTVSEGAPATTISNTPISLGTNDLMIGSNTILYSAASAPPPAVTITMNGETYTIQNSAIQFAGVPVSEGAPATTISNTSISPGPSNLILGGSTILYSMPSATDITINNEPLNLESSAVIAAGSITISEGASAVTVSGTAISLGSTDIVVGSTRLEYSQAAGTQSSGDVAAAIMSALGRTEAASSATGTATGTSNTTSSGVAPTTSQQPFTAGAATSVPVARLVMVLTGMGTCLIALRVLDLSALHIDVGVEQCISKAKSDLGICIWIDGSYRYIQSRSCYSGRSNGWQESIVQRFFVYRFREIFHALACDKCIIPRKLH